MIETVVQGMRLGLDMLRRWLGSIAIAILSILTMPGPLSADELSSVFDQLLSRPDDPALNIRYADLVEARGDTRKALAAYERALARDPGNRELIRAYRRVKRRLQPRITAWTVDTGITWASNPRQLPSSDIRRKEDTTFDINLLLFDERTIARHRWRSLGRASTQMQGDIDDLSDAVVSFVTGPVFELGKQSRLHVAPGGEIAWLDQDWLYQDLKLKLTFETLFKGATQTVTAEVINRDTNSKFRGNDGVVFQVVGRFAKYNKLKPGDSLYFIPRFRYSEATGSGPDRVFNRALFPGNFVEFGGRKVYYMPVRRGRAFLGGGFGVYYRDYNQNVAFSTAGREDWFLEPTAHLIVPHVGGSKFDFRIDYRLEHNDSNDPLQDFENHVVGARTVRRF